MEPSTPLPQDATSEVVWSLGLVPVQGWIAEARRSRDLLAGSAILSWLMGRLLAELSKAGARVEQPAGWPPQRAGAPGSAAAFGLRLMQPEYGIPNRASGRMVQSVATASGCFRDLDAKLAASWAHLIHEVESNAAGSSSGVWARVGPAVRDAPCPFQLIWAIRDAGSATGQEVERLFAAVKRSRRILPHDGFPVPKCVQCGRREAARGEEMAQWRRFQTELADLPAVESGLRIEPGERLCGVCLLKRFAGYLRPDAFPSTSGIASRRWRWRLTSEADLREALTALQAAIGNVAGYGHDWSDPAPLFYRRTLLRETRLAKEEGDPAKVEALSAVAAAQTELGRQVVAWNEDRPEARRITTRPPPYLAVLTFDGDDVGEKRWLVEGLADAMTSFHQAVIARLAKPVESAENWTETPPPSLALAEPFYLGGDEGLLLVPAADAVGAASELRELWRDKIEPLGADAPTLSAGVAIFDRERPLGPAIEAAQAALVRAKQRRKPGTPDVKDALAVHVSTASGSAWTAVSGWQEGWPWARRALELLRERRLAAGWPHDVERFLRSLNDEVWSAGEVAWAAVREEVKRLTYRRAEPGAGASGPQAEDDIRERGAAAWARLGGDSLWTDQLGEEERATLADLLHLLAFLNRRETSDVA